MSIPVEFNLIAEAYNTADQRLILLDYDGTLVPLCNDLHAASPDGEVRKLLSELASAKQNDVIMISGRRREDLDLFFGKCNWLLVAEHGGFYKTPAGEWRQTFPIEPSWIPGVLKALKALTFQHEGSFVEEKYYSLAWHYRSIAENITDNERTLITDAIRRLPDFGKFNIQENNFTIELRTPHIDKGAFVNWLALNDYPFRMALGDGLTDEDLFRILDRNDYTIRVGESSYSSARYHVPSQKEVLPFFAKLLSVNNNFERMKLGIGLS